MRNEGITRTEKGWKYYSHSVNDLCEMTTLEIEENGDDHYHVLIRTPAESKEFNLVRGKYATDEIDGVLQVAEVFKKYEPQEIIRGIMREFPGQVKDVFEKKKQQDIAIDVYGQN